MEATNPFFESWDTPFGLPPFHLILPGHFPPAFERALAEHRAEVEAIETNAEEPSFANTIHALEESGKALNRVNSVFWNLVGAHTNDALSAIERDIAPELARHDNAIYMSRALFERVDALFKEHGRLGLTQEQERVLHLTHTHFVRSGAMLVGDEKERLAAIIERLATLGTAFSQNVLADEKDYMLVLETEQDLAGLPDFLLAATAGAAETRGQSGKHVVTLSRSIIEPFLQFSTRRDLREKAFTAWTMRGQNDNANNNIGIITEMVQLRAERARLLGYKSFADFKLDDEMAKTPEAARALLETVWPRAKARADRERADLQALADLEGGAARIGPHDWRYYSEKVRRQRHDLDETELKPYLQLDHIIEASFYTASRLFGLSFNEIEDAPRYHEDIRIWEVTGRSGEHVGVFIGDYFNRPSKRSGAWMSAYRTQHKVDGSVRPIIVNVMNFAKAEGGPTLLSFDDARTLFHEFGHGLHGLLSDVTYPMVAGTSVARDFVELPSQLYEHWFMQPEILRKFAVHAETGEALPESLLKKVMAARNFNQGFQTVEYTASALVDLDYHALASADNLDPVAFEADSLARIGMPNEITMRHRSPHFTHVFSGDGYSSGYYSYLWSEVLDADGFQAFVEKRDIFDPETAQKLHDFIYSAGNSRDPVEAYMGFRGHMPAVEPLLEKRGLI
ncbi:MAG: M3 family metallopeptidase [Beijerinckiaceae bacterium]|nr:M3 family metallopeptidase [Beijerinckiaceae bacterium]